MNTSNKSSRIWWGEFFPSLKAVMAASLTKEEALKRLQMEDSRLEAQERLAAEETALVSARSQVAIVRKRLEEVRKDIALFEGSTILQRRVEVSEQDEIDLSLEFSKSLYRVLDSVRSPAAVEPSGHDATAQSQNTAANASAGGAESMNPSDAEHSDASASTHTHDRSTHDSDEDTAPSSARSFDHIRVLWQPTTPRTHKGGSSSGPSTHFTVRLHEAYSFSDLRSDACRHLSLGDQIELMEIVDLHSHKAWPESSLVIQEMRKGIIRRGSEYAGKGGDDAARPTVLLREVPLEVRGAEEDDRRRLQEIEMKHEIVNRAMDAKERASRLRAIGFSRKKSRHARSLLNRGIIHLVALAVFVVSISDGVNRGYESNRAVRQALEATFSSNPTWARSLTCAERYGADSNLYHADPTLVGLPAGTQQHAMTLKEIKTPEEVHAWLRTALVDAIAPQCTYSGIPITYDENITGAVG